MRKIVLVTLALGLLSTAASAADLELVPGKQYQLGDYFEQPYTLKNHTSHLIRRVHAECGMFNNNELVHTSGMSFRNVPPQGELYDFVNSNRGEVTDVRCRLTDAE